jgi:hypothetical protein
MLIFNSKNTVSDFMLFLEVEVSAVRRTNEVGGMGSGKNNLSRR